MPRMVRQRRRIETDQHRLVHGKKPWSGPERGIDTDQGFASFWWFSPDSLQMIMYVR